MKAKNCTFNDLQKALAIVNKKYKNNVKFNPDSTGIKKFTLRPVKSAGPGGRRGHTGRRVYACCWHVHGDFFDALFTVAPDAVIKTGTKTIDRYQGNWEDWNIGSVYSPMMFSEACDCDK